MRRRSAALRKDYSAGKRFTGRSQDLSADASNLFDSGKTCQLFQPLSICRSEPCIPETIHIMPAKVIDVFRLPKVALATYKLRLQTAGALGSNRIGPITFAENYYANP
ncbi:hypothetical protein ECMM28_4441 [Escherichia coli]|nr:hypothetical protein ECMM28_4441 [Escherichia coli]